MNKKQAAIIVTLLVLIICAGVLATVANNPLYVNSNNSNAGKKTAASVNSSKSKDTSSDYYTEQRLTREQDEQQTTQNLKSIMDDKNIAQDSRNSAAQKYTEVTTMALNEKKIESELKNKGYQDSLCYIDNNKAHIIVKSQDKLTDKQSKEISEIVMNVSKIKDVLLETKH